MGKFLETEKPKQGHFKATAPYFSQPARGEGVYRGKPRPFCLPVECAEQNLFPAIRQSAPAFFNAHQIKWHDGQNGKPSNHLCDSQVCCVNFLFPFVHQPEALKRLLLPLYPEIESMLPVEHGRYVSFEWIGEVDYLNELRKSDRRRTRGANSTSADVIVRFERQDKHCQVVLIEWKYTESYGYTSLEKAQSGTDRTEIYRKLWDSPDCPLDRQLLPSFKALFYEPFYQLMRQQFLAHEMEKAHEMGADIVSLLHIAPGHNEDFRRVTSTALVGLGYSPTAIWKKVVKNPTRFTSVSTEQLFGGLTVEEMPEMGDWLEYIQRRYDWVGLCTDGVDGGLAGRVKVI
jgi:hypothetical protein